MDIKKSDKANLDNHRSTGFLLGLILALALLFAAFEYTTRPQSADEDDTMLDDLTEDLTMKSAPQDTRDMVSAVAAPASKAITQNVKEVAHVDNAEKIAPLTSKLLIGGGQAVEKEANVTEALPQVTADKDTAVMRTVEQIPEFPGGIVQFMKWLTRNLRYPPQAQQQQIQGKVVVSFIVNKDGSISSPTVVHSVDPILDNEALRVIKMMPRWKPGLDKGKPCRTMFAIPVNFVL
ncbi:protein TonB [Hallella multisaccharivorax DSM 17128]|uniref:Outer membrane transport energization protein TonB (TC 2.C.1.1.1) n=1 Tax=Hallella multisaccharivorax DSM 17128 TaxID=688246 RepID=F8NC38_9BACT|nr:energy transducer TonB [Hallella multisaccharivorax]EGN57005.1 outer membrane transport energization protein TonB (TC 2.C.1.1.1) [Hallella multisaccharivorax DSM 17128]GJG30546.1 protein TonB [Hallella multisaccharivorax DSM 17128]